MASPTNLERALNAIKRIGSFSEGEKDAISKAFRTAIFPGSWSLDNPNDDDILQYDAATETWSPQTLPGGTFLSLSDTPSSYTGEGGKVVKVSTGYDPRLVFAGINITELIGVWAPSPDDGDVLMFDFLNGWWENAVLDIDHVTPTTTKGDIIVEDGSNAVRLGIGTNGHVLTANSGAANGLEWAAPVTGFADPMTTRGDLIYKNSGGTTVRLPAGTANYVLTSDGTDIAWAASIAGVSAFTGLSDVPSSYTGEALKLVRVNAGETALEFVTGGSVTNVTGSSPIASSGGNTPNITIQAATSGQHGYMSSTYAAKLDGIEANADVTDAANVAAAGAWIGSITVSSSAPSGGNNGDVWFQVT